MPGDPGTNGVFCNFLHINVQPNLTITTLTCVFVGQKGFTGESGERGEPGFDGIQGIKGNSGDPGISGFTGKRCLSLSLTCQSQLC